MASGSRTKLELYGGRQERRWPVVLQQDGLAGRVSAHARVSRCWCAGYIARADGDGNATLVPWVAGLRPTD